MFRHIVLFTWTDAATDDQIATAIDGIRDLANQIDGVRQLTVGSDAGLAAGNFDVATVVDFADEAAYQAYAAHPAHTDLIAQHLKPILQERAAVQHQVVTP
ncbi:Dabb family protein [Euzebya tangerina]|uniref:Dabb family protein n=1 Tax=Euzebya tangerina TaxID=591198 RepID=UPI000E31E3AA|nr:Dabb family protein [Euzebya tangerina]